MGRDSLPLPIINSYYGGRRGKLCLTAFDKLIYESRTRNDGIFLSFCSKHAVLHTEHGERFNPLWGEEGRWTLWLTAVAPFITMGSMGFGEEILPGLY